MSVKKIQATNDDDSVQTFSDSSSTPNVQTIKVPLNVPIILTADTSINPLGTVSITAGGNIVTGVGTNFLSTLKVGSRINANNETHTVASVDSDLQVTTDSWSNAGSDVSYTYVQ